MFNISRTFLTVLMLSLTANAGAQDTEILANQELPEFRELQIQLNTEVIIIKSSRNRLTIQSYEKLLPLFKTDFQNGRLAIYSEVKTSAQPTRILVETTNLESLITGGTGFYTVIGLEDQSLTVFNPSAVVSLRGELETVHLISTSGYTDMSQLKTGEELVQLASGASFVESKARFSKLFAEAKN